MRIVGSASYVEDRARRRVWRGGLFVVAGAVLLIAGVISTQSQEGSPAGWAGSASTFLGLGGLLVGALQIVRSGREQQASAGEAPVIAQLSARFGDEYVYLRRVAVPGHLAEADGVLLGPHGALVLAIRAVSGQFIVRGDDWFMVDAAGEERPWNRSPTWELARPLRVLQRAAEEEGLGKVRVQGAVILVQARLVNAERPSMAVVPVDRIATYVDYLRPPEPEQETALLIEQLIHHLEPYAGGQAPRPRAQDVP